MYKIDELEKIPCFGVAGNFTGHLEQAGEAADFANVKTDDAAAPKAIFPTYIPIVDRNTQRPEIIPEFLTNNPFSSTFIFPPAGEANIQTEPECAILFDAEWQNGVLCALKAKAFFSSNDCSIRRPGAKKISEKKNWGVFTKGLANEGIEIDSFAPGGILDDYSIASFLLRDGVLHKYGETSKISSYSYFYQKLTDWLIEKFNYQKDEGPAENVHEYLAKIGFPNQIIVSVGATRYTPFGETTFLKENDESCVVVFPHKIFNEDEIKNIIEKRYFSIPRISFLIQKVVRGKVW